VAVLGWTVLQVEAPPANQAAARAATRSAMESCRQQQWRPWQRCGLERGRQWGDQACRHCLMEACLACQLMSSRSWHRCQGLIQRQPTACAACHHICSRRSCVEVLSLTSETLLGNSWRASVKHKTEPVEEEVLPVMGRHDHHHQDRPDQSTYWTMDRSPRGSLRRLPLSK